MEFLQYLPFATDTNPTSDLAKFYRDCASAPPLMQDTLVASATTSSSQHSAAACADDDLKMDDSCGSIDDLTRQLEHFETSLDDYDSLVNSLCCQSADEVDSNSNS